MSFWIHAYCNSSVASVTPRELTAGIAERLKLLTYLFCPEHEEEPAIVLQRFRIEDVSTDGTFRTYLMHYRHDSPAFIRVDRRDEPDEVRGGIEELDDQVLSRRIDPGIQQVKDLLYAATEQVSFCLKAYDVEAMGFPLSIAAAAYLVQKAGGIIQSGAYSWMLPHGNEVRRLLEFDV